MYLHLGQGVVVRQRDVVGIFDLDNTSASFRTRRTLERAERAGQTFAVSEELPKSFVLCRGRDGRDVIYLTQLSSAALRGRAESNSFE